MPVPQPAPVPTPVSSIVRSISSDESSSSELPAIVPPPSVFPAQPQPRPEIKEKPQFSTFKQQQRRGSGERASHRLAGSANNNIGNVTRLSKVASESDLVKTMAKEVEQLLQHERERSQPPATMISRCELQIVEEPAPVNSMDLAGRQNSEEDEDGANKLIIDTSKAFTRRSVSNDSLLSEPASAKGRSEPLQITTEPLNDLRIDEDGDDDDDEEEAVGGKSSCSTSFESAAETDDSLLAESRNNQVLTSDTSVVSADLNGTLRTKSPSTSTTSRSPPSPEPNGLAPVRQVRK